MWDDFDDFEEQEAGCAADEQEVKQEHESGQRSGRASKGKRKAKAAFASGDEADCQ